MLLWVAEMACAMPTAIKQTSLATASDSWTVRGAMNTGQARWEMLGWLP